MGGDFSLKGLGLAVFFSLMVILIVFFASFIDQRTKIVFCDVGQGDAAYIRIKNQIDVLVDTGPDRKILSCLGKQMPFYDREIELVIISHPQKDHFGGFLYLVDRYKIDKVILTKVDSSAQSYSVIKRKLVNNKINISLANAGERVTIGQSQFSFYWPTKKFLTDHLVFDRPRKIYNLNLGASGLESNYFTLIFMYEENNFRVLFTGDAPTAVLNKLLGQNKLKTTVLKIPHHGSKNGLNKNFLQLADPELSVISVGKNNSYGQPAKQVLETLQALKIKIQRTDQEGDIILRISN